MAKVSISLWESGYQSAALITIDDFSPLYLPGLDYGGRIDKEGILERVIIGEIIENFPFIKVNLFTIPNNRFNLMNPFWWFPDGTNLLSNNLDWVKWVKEMLEKYSQLVLGYHGWVHCRKITNTPDEFVGYETKEETERALNNMLNEFKKVGLPVDNVFRPPGWGLNPWLLDWLADNEIILGDQPISPTCQDSFRPSWYALPSGKKLLRISVNGAERDIEKIISQGGSFIKHFHFTEPDANALSRRSNVEELKRVIGYIHQKWGGKVAWLSYGEMGEHFKRVDKVKYKVEEKNGEVVLKTGNSKEELQGVTFVFDEKPRRVQVLDLREEKLEAEWAESPDNYLLIIRG